MAEEPSFDILELLPCDRIIREDNGKFSLIGAYSGGVVLPLGLPFPVQLQLWYWMRIQRKKATPTQIRFEVTNPEGSIVFATDGIIASTDLHPTVIAIAGMNPTSLTGYGTYTAYLTADGQRLNIGTFVVEPQKTETPPQQVG
jgi:hypothetical protein